MLLIVLEALANLIIEKKKFVLDTFDLFTGLDNVIQYFYKNKVCDSDINDLIFSIIKTIID